MFDYHKLYEPFAREGHGLDNTIKWLKDTTKASDLIIDQVISETMQELSEGRKFRLPCPCGCGFEAPYLNAHIDHHMLKKAIDLKSKAEKAFITVVQEKEKQRLQARMKQLSKFDKEYNKMRNGTFWEKFKKFVGAPYRSWETEKKQWP